MPLPKLTYNQQNPKQSFAYRIMVHLFQIVTKIHENYFIFWIQKSPRHKIYCFHSGMKLILTMLSCIFSTKFRGSKTTRTLNKVWHLLVLFMSHTFLGICMCSSYTTFYRILRFEDQISLSHFQRSQIHSEVKTEIYSHTFLVKISWK